MKCSVVLQSRMFFKEGMLSIFALVQKFTLSQGAFTSRSFKSLPKSRREDLTASSWWAAALRQVLWVQDPFSALTLFHSKTSWTLPIASNRRLP